MHFRDSEAVSVELSLVFFNFAKQQSVPIAEMEALNPSGRRDMPWKLIS